MSRPPLRGHRPRPRLNSDWTEPVADWDLLQGRTLPDGSLNVDAINDEAPLEGDEGNE
jgi:hypothetical protein